MNEKLPLIEQMHNADDDRARARVLLQCPDHLLMKYRPVFEDACRRAQFDLGVEFIAARRAAWHAVRGADGRHRQPDFDRVREDFARFAAGEVAS